MRRRAVRRRLRQYAAYDQTTEELAADSQSLATVVGVLCRLRLSGNALFRRDRTIVGMMGFSAVGPSRVLLRAEQRAHGRRRIAPTRCHGRPAHAADDTLALTRWPTVHPLMLRPHTRDPSEV